MSRPPVCTCNYGWIPLPTTAAVLGLLLLLAASSTDANEGHRHRRSSSSDLSEALSQEASRIAEGNKTSLPVDNDHQVSHPPKLLGIALEEISHEHDEVDKESRTGHHDYDDLTGRRPHTRHSGSSRAALFSSDMISQKTQTSSQTTRTPALETQLNAPTSGSLAATSSTMSPLNKLFEHLVPDHKDTAKKERKKKSRRKKKKRSEHGKTAHQEKAIKELSKLGKKLKDQAPSVIFINGRKFNQIEKAACVDDKFYQLLIKDLAEVIPHKRLDTYETYYDYNYAKAVAAVLDTPKLHDAHMKYREDQGEVLLNGLEELQKYWNTTMTVYRELKAKHHGRIRSEVAVHRWLYERLEGLKALLMKGEESLVALNNRVRKLNKAPREKELQQALCSCITSRSGKTVIGIMNELFVDKNSQTRLKDLEYARKQGLAMAEDAASYCAYWYGDTIRTQAKMKEKHIQGMVTTLSHNRSLIKQLQKHYKINQTVVTTTSVISNVNGSEMTQVKTAIVTRLIDMTDLWLPKMADWIRSKLDIVVTGNGSDSSGGSPQTLVQELLLAPTTNKPRRVKPTNRKSGRKAARRERARRSATFSTPMPGGVESIVPLHPDEPNSRDSPTSMTTMMMKNGTLSISGTSTTTTRKPKSKRRKIRESQFEAEISKYGEQCAKKGFSILLWVAYDQSTLMYNSDKISLEHEYIRTLEESFSSSFKRVWRQKRNHWSRKMSQPSNGTGAPEVVSAKPAPAPVPQRTVDEEMSDSFEAVGSSYERGMRLGYMVGRFVGEKAARQWPDPAELNTFTYDSLFLAGLASGYNETATRELEQNIVTETTKRIAFAEASRQVFAKTLVSSYQNGASMVPIWGVLHGQRAVSKQAAKEGAKVGYDASVKAASEFGPKAHKFFLTHRMQRALSSPYKAAAAAATASLPDEMSSGGNSSTSSSTNGSSLLPHSAPMMMGAHEEPMGVSREIDQVQLEIEVHRSVSREATKCGKETGLVMGALMGLVVTPEAFESFSRFRGSLEALENEFNHFKLGALRGYQFGENSAYLNYTAMLNQNLASMKNETGMERAAARDAANKRAANSTAAPFADDQDDEGLAKTGNVFQFMIVNYGSYLVANHSSKSMLKIRSQVPDESVLQQIQLEAQDYLPGLATAATAATTTKPARGSNSSKMTRKERRQKLRERTSKTGRKLRKNKKMKKALTLNNSTTTAQPDRMLKPPAMMNTTMSKPVNMSRLSVAEVDELDSLFGRQKTIGELSGFLIANQSTSEKLPLRVNILDLGPRLELEENELESNASEIRMATTDLKPLTDTLAKLGKVFIKLQVARPENERPKKHTDPLADFLNAAQWDDGDGYMCGTFTHSMPGKPANGTGGNPPAMQVDDLSLEVSLLDELARRIEEPTRNYPRTSSIELVENVLGPTRDLTAQGSKAL